MCQEEPVGSGYAGLVLLAALAAIELSQTLTADQMNLLGAFFEILGDNLELLALSPSPCFCSPKKERTVEE